MADGLVVLVLGAGFQGMEAVVSRDPRIERVDEALGMVKEAEASRAITAGAAMATMLAVAGVVVVVVIVFWLLA